MNFPENDSKHQKSIVYLYVAHFEEKNKLLLIFAPFYWFEQKLLFKQIQNFPQDLSLFKLVKKSKLSGISVLFYEIVIFGLKREDLCKYPPKYFKTTEKHSLAVCVTLYGEFFFYIFGPFYWFAQKNLFKQIQIFLRIFPFSNMLRKTNLLSISVLLSEVANFLSKKRSSL